MTTSFLLLRHGQSTWNAVRRWQGQADPPLTEAGEAQAIEAGAALAAIDGRDRLHGVVTSTLQRAARTGELIAEATDLPVVDSIADLCERSAGPWQGLTRVEIGEQYPGFLESGMRPDGYEADADVVLRATAALDRLAAAHPGKRLVVVSHGGLIGAIEDAVGVGAGAFQRVDNLAGRWFEQADGELRAVGDRVKLLGDTGADGTE